MSETITLDSKTKIEHRKILRRYVVLAFANHIWIARRCLFSKRRAVRHARYLEAWGITIQSSRPAEVVADLGSAV